MSFTRLKGSWVNKPIRSGAVSRGRRNGRKQDSPIYIKLYQQVRDEAGPLPEIFIDMARLFHI